MAKVSIAEATARDVIDDDTVVERRLLAALQQTEREMSAVIRVVEQTVWRAAQDGEVSADEVATILHALRAGRERLLARMREHRDTAAESLDRNRLVAGLLCLHVAGIDPRSPKAAARLAELPTLLARFVAAEDPEDLVA